MGTMKYVGAFPLEHPQLTIERGGGNRSKDYKYRVIESNFPAFSVGENSIKVIQTPGGEFPTSFSGVKRLVL